MKYPSSIDSNHVGVGVGVGVGVCVRLRSLPTRLAPGYPQLRGHRRDQDAIQQFLC